MFLTTHVVAGAAIGRNVESLPLASAIGFVSHFVLDMIPHWNPEYLHDPHANVKDLIRHTMKPLIAITVFIDILLAVSITWILLVFTPSREERIRVGLAIGASVTPDILDLARFVKPLKGVMRPFNRMHDKAQHEVTHPLLGLITQGIVVAVVTIWDLLLMSQ